MFGKDFFPTPENVLDLMLFDTDLSGKVILEPSAGRGNMIEYALKHGAKQVLCCELDRDLAKICSSKGQFITYDFLTLKSDDISHIDVILMNPPFSADEKHILHAFDIAPGGCEIFALCNYNTYSQPYTQKRELLKSIITEHGYITDLGEAFSTAERKTDVRVGFIRLFKPKSGDNEFDGYFDTSEEIEPSENGIMPFNEIRNIVNRYVGAVRMFDNAIDSANAINSLIEPINESGGIQFGAFKKNSRSDLVPINRSEFKKELQKSAWRSVFKKLNIAKFVTQSVMEDINRFVEKQENVPFSIKNIYKMFEIIVGTRHSRMQKVIVEAFDSITKHYDENRFQLEGWKTNSEYMVNKKFIAPYIIECSWSGEMTTNYRKENFMDDIHKALCFVTGTDFNETPSFRDFLLNVQIIDSNTKQILSSEEIEEAKRNNLRTERKYLYREFGKLHEWGFFKFRGYKKGTAHFEFKDVKVWEEFNRVACKAKGFMLASKYTSDFRTKSSSVDLFHSQFIHESA